MNDPHDRADYIAAVVFLLFSLLLLVLVKHFAPWIDGVGR